MDDRQETIIWVNGRARFLSVDVSELWTTSGRLDITADRIDKAARGVRSHLATAIGSVPFDSLLSNGWVGAASEASACMAGLVTTLRAYARSVGRSAESYGRTEESTRGSMDGLGASLQTILPGVPAVLGVMADGASPLLGLAYTVGMASTGQSDPVKALTQLLGSAFGGEKEARKLEGQVFVSAERSSVPPTVPARENVLSGTLRSVETAYGIGRPKRDGAAFNGQQNEIPPSSVVVDKYRREDGNWAVMVSIPGFQPPGIDTPKTTNDGRGIAATAAQPSAQEQYRTQTQAAVMKALEAEGITKKDQVVLTGHSLGGMNAVALASDKGFTDKYNVRAVTTAGSPVGNSVGKVPAGTSVLALENAEDPVPSLDNAVNPVKENVVTAVTPGVPAGWGLDAHQIANYIPAAESLDASRIPEVDRHRAVLNDVFGPSQLRRDGNGKLLEASRTVYTAHEGADPGEKCLARSPTTENADVFRQGKPGYVGVG